MRSCSRSLAGVCATVRLGFATGPSVGEAVSNRPKFPQADKIKARHSKAGAAQRRRPSPLKCRSAIPVTSATRLVKLVRAKQLDLFHPNHFDPRPGSRLDKAANPNPTVFEGLRRYARRLERRKRAPWNSHSEVPCPVPAEIQISGCPCLSYRQNPAFDQHKTPIPGQDIARTFRVFYDGRTRPGSPFGVPGGRLGRQQDGGAVLVGEIGRGERFALCQQHGLHRICGAIEEHEGRLTAIAVGHVVLAVQRHILTGDDRRQRGGAVRQVARDGLDAGKADFATIGEAKAARIDHRGDAAFALLLKRAWRRRRRIDRGDRYDARCQCDERERASDSGHQVRPVAVCCKKTIATTLSQFASKGETMEINGIAHIFLTASNFQRSREFYRKLLPFLGLKPVIDTETTYYCVGGRTAVGISAPSAEHQGAAFEQKRVGLHHLCFRARERADIDELHAFLGTVNANIIRAPREDQWAPGYYSILFEDPDGIRLELNHVPGKGLLG